jgi:iron complex outermembrane receptor protein
VTAFHNWYDDIRTTELTNGSLPIQLRNGIRGRSWGMEAWGTIQATEGWRITLGATRLWKDFVVKDGRSDLANLAALGDDPKWQIKAGTQIDVLDNVQLSLDGRWVAALETAPRIPSYVEASGRLAWVVADPVELFVAGRNLLHASHLESNDLNQGQRPQRSIVAGSRLRF